MALILLQSKRLTFLELHQKRISAKIGRDKADWQSRVARAS